LAISADHGIRAGLLPGPDKGPFDRMLIAQAQAENIAIIGNENAVLKRMALYAFGKGFLNVLILNDGDLATIGRSLSDANHPATGFSGASYNAPAQLAIALLGGIVVTSHAKRWRNPGRQDEAVLRTHQRVPVVPEQLEVRDPVQTLAHQEYAL
jgi:hypothetical protein